MIACPWIPSDAENKLGAFLQPNEHEAARLAADAEDMATLEQTERQLEDKGRGERE